MIDYQYGKKFGRRQAGMIMLICGLQFLVIGPAIYVIAILEGTVFLTFLGATLCMVGAYMTGYGLKDLIRTSPSEVVCSHAQKDETVSQ